MRAFVIPEKRAHLSQLLSSARGRQRVMEELADPRILDPRFAHRVPIHDQEADRIHALLMSKGALEKCYVMGEGALDGREMRLGDALDRLVNVSFGNVISCVPGRLAYFGTEGPNERYILER